MLNPITDSAKAVAFPWLLGGAAVAVLVIAGLIWGWVADHDAKVSSLALATETNTTNGKTVTTLVDKVTACVDAKAQAAIDADAVKKERDDAVAKAKAIALAAAAARAKAYNSDDACKAWAKAPVCPEAAL